MGEKFPKPLKVYNYYRKLFEDKDIDAVCIAIPNHWHALITVHAIQAGKDVYVEKPLTATIFEDRKTVETQANSNRVIAVGLNRRGCGTYQYDIAPYMFRWWSDYSSQIGNWGVHFMDVIPWMLGETAPVAISAH